MPLRRYFLVVGSVLLALLFVVDWYLPSPSPMQSYGAPIEASTLHIRSEQKWPQRLQFDVAAPAILPPSPPADAATAIEDPKLNALAEVRPPEQQEKQVVVKPKPRVAKHRNRQPPEALRFAVNPTPSTWPPSW